jgi:septum formation protein
VVPIVLASASPRRRALLAHLGVAFTVAAPDIDESPLSSESPVDYVGRLAVAKARAVPAPEGALVIAADTTVDLGGEILGKPTGAADAAAMLRRLSGRTHKVHTGVAVGRDGRTLDEVSTSLVTFARLTDEEIDWYVATGEPFDKAGAYAIQGAGSVLVQRVQGSVSGIVGLPMHTLVRLAAQLGVPLTTRPAGPPT